MPPPKIAQTSKIHKKKTAVQKEIIIKNPDLVMHALSHGNAARGYSALERSVYEAPAQGGKIPREDPISLKYIYIPVRKHVFIVYIILSYIM